MDVRLGKGNDATKEDRCDGTDGEGEKKPGWGVTLWEAQNQN